MFIIWGKKHVYRKLGFVADFCEICRAPKAFLMRRVGLAGHVYYISLGEGELAGFQRTCEDCNTTFHANPNLYATISKKAASFDDLQQQTYPNLQTVIADRLALEEKVRSTPALLTAAERKELIQTPFSLLAAKVEKQYSAIHIDKETVFTILGTLALLFIVPGILQSVAPDHTDLGVLILLSLGTIAIVTQLALANRRFMRRQIIPVLTKSLQPLRPTEKELRTVLDDMKTLKYKMGAKLKAADLLAALHA